MAYIRIVPTDWYRKRWEILLRDDFTCRYCGQSAPNVKLEVDHVIPVAEGGTDDADNLVTSCWACNQGKEGYRAHERWLKKQGTRVRRKQAALPSDLGAARVLVYLTENPGPHTVYELADALNLSVRGVQYSLRSLRLDGSVVSSHTKIGRAKCWELAPAP